MFWRVVVDLLLRFWREYGDSLEIEFVVWSLGKVGSRGFFVMGF